MVPLGTPKETAGLQDGAAGFWFITPCHWRDSTSTHFPLDLLLRFLLGKGPADQKQHNTTYTVLDDFKGSSRSKNNYFIEQNYHSPYFVLGKHF